MPPSLYAFAQRPGSTSLDEFQNSRCDNVNKVPFWPAILLNSGGRMVRLA